MLIFTVASHTYTLYIIHYGLQNFLLSIGKNIFTAITSTNLQKKKGSPYPGKTNDRIKFDNIHVSQMLNH